MLRAVDSDGRRVFWELEIVPLKVGCFGTFRGPDVPVWIGTRDFSRGLLMFLPGSQP